MKNQIYFFIIIIYLDFSSFFYSSLFLMEISYLSIHLEVASDSFCFLINSSWLLVFILYVFSLFFLERANWQRRCDRRKG